MPKNSQINDQARDNDFQQIVYLLTANFEGNKIDLGVIHKKIQQSEAYQPIRDDYANIFGLSRDANEWPDEILIRLFLRLYSYEISRMQHDICLITYHRTLFTTRDGYIGVGPRWIRPGDKISLISGLTLPFVIREKKENYNLIGPAYVHGIMEGERWDGMQVTDIELV